LNDSPSRAKRNNSYQVRGFVHCRRALAQASKLKVPATSQLRGEDARDARVAMGLSPGLVRCLAIRSKCVALCLLVLSPLAPARCPGVPKDMARGGAHGGIELLLRLRGGAGAAAGRVSARTPSKIRDRAPSTQPLRRETFPSVRATPSSPEGARNKEKERDRQQAREWRPCRR
jgi:hypothetical protein